MTDTMTRERRSWTMSRIRSRDTKPEMLVRRYLFSRGLRYRVNVRGVPGHPDIVLARHHALVEVRGCFWHRHQPCKIATTPKSHVRFWKAKFKRNVERDRLHEAQWAEAGWRVFVVWECELRPAERAATLERLYSAIVAPPREAAARLEYDATSADEGMLLAAESDDGDLARYCSTPGDGACDGKGTAKRRSGKRG